MKKYILKILSMILILATLMPLAVACNDDPPAGVGGGSGEGSGSGEGGGGGSGEGGGSGSGSGSAQTYIKAVQKSTDVKSIIDFDSNAFAQNNPTFASYVDGTHGKTAFKWNLAEKSSVSLRLGQSVDVRGYYYIEFDVYSQTASDTVVSIMLVGCKTPQKIRLDFSGWVHYRIRCEEFSVVEPYPEITAIALSYESGSKNNPVFITSVKATKPIYELEVPSGIDISDPALYKSITDKRREFLVGHSKESYSASYTRRLGSVNGGCTNAWQQFKETYSDGEPNKTFELTLFTGEGASKYLDGPNILKYYQTLEKMVKGYATPGSQYYKNEELFADILLGLEYGYNYGYGADIVANGKNYGNWWEWDIAIPMSLTDILVMLENDLEPMQIKKYLAPFDIFVPIPMGAACNKVAMTRCVLLAGALERDAMRIVIAREMTNEIFYFFDDENAYGGIRTNDDGGFKSDGSFIQHNGTPAAGQYGIGFIGSLTQLMYFMQGSPFAFYGDFVDNQYSFVFDCFRNSIYGTNFMASMSGRSVDYKQTEYEIFTSFVGALAVMQSYAPAEYKKDVEALLRYYMIMTENDYSRNVSFPFIDYCTALYTNESVSISDVYEATVVFGGMDRAVQHLEKYGVAIALSSTRIYKYEAINTENETGWYHGDGMMFIYTDGYDYSWEYYWYANPYKMPGTTVNLAERNAVCLSPSMYGGSPYAGGVQQGKYGAIGYINCYPESIGNGTFASYNGSKISTNKSYFLFDNEIVCLGSGIKDYTGNEVITTVENRLWRENDTVSVGGAPVATPPRNETTVTDRTMHFTNMGGYVFLGNTVGRVSYNKAVNGPVTNFGPSSINPADYPASRSFLEIMISHGKSNATTGSVGYDKYSYLYLPEASAEETEAYATSPDIKILALKDNVHAVLEKKLGIVAANFFAEYEDVLRINESGIAVKSIESESPASIMVTKGENGEYTISISDPTQTYRQNNIYIEIEGVSQVVSADGRINAEIDGGIISMIVNTENARGATLTLTVK